MNDGRTLTAKQFLDYFLFDYDKQYVKVAKLSGGEKRRLYLLTVLLKKPNFLILDEPTNDLDIMTLGVLEDYLSHFNGCVLIVSHDRYFMDNIVDHIFTFKEEGTIKDFPGTYTQYREQILQDFQQERAKGEKKQKKPAPEKTRPRAASYKEKMEYQSLEKEIEQLEQEKASIEKELNEGRLDNQEMVEKSNRLGELMKAIDQKTDRYLELSEIVESNP
jgi:ATP-binding cassette subfamily F protein uup